VEIIVVLAAAAAVAAAAAKKVGGGAGREMEWSSLAKKNGLRGYMQIYKKQSTISRPEDSMSKGIPATIQD
jgi:hypothetical protein